MILLIYFAIIVYKFLNFVRGAYIPIVSLAAVVTSIVGPKLAPLQRLLTRTTHSIPFVQWTNKIRALITAKIKRQPLASDEASVVV